MRLAGRRVFVAGGTGFVGGRLCERLLLEEGADVRVLVRDWARAVWVSRTMAELVQGNVTDRAAVEAAMHGRDIVFHCASGGSTRSEYFATNVDGTRTILEAARAAGVQRVVYVSSIAVHGPSPPPNADESAPFQSTGKAYGESKIAAERLVRQWVEAGELSIAVIRPTFVWGPRSALFTMNPLRAMKQGRFQLVDEGRGSCHAVHVDNLVEAMILAGVHPAAEGEAFFVTDPGQRTWAEFFQPLAELVGISSLPSISSRSPAVRWMSRAKDRLGTRLDLLAGNPAPLTRRIIRRTIRELHEVLARRGIPSEWDLEKFARRGGLESSKLQTKLGYEAVLEFDEGMNQTLAWVRDQMNCELGLPSDTTQHA